MLSILDAKASALMRLNGVMLAAAAFLLNAQNTSGRAVNAWVAGSAIGSTISITLCLFVVSVDWRFLGLVVQSGRTELDYTDEFYHLQKVASFRQLLYRVAWTVSLITTVAILIALVLFFLYL